MSSPGSNRSGRCVLSKRSHLSRNIRAVTMGSRAARCRGETRINGALVMTFLATSGIRLRRVSSYSVTFETLLLTVTPRMQTRRSRTQT